MVTPHPPVPDCQAGVPAMSVHPPSSAQPIQPWKPPQALQRLGDAPAPPPLPFPQGMITSSIIPPVQVLECPKETDTQSGRIVSLPLNCQQSPLRSISMLQSSLQEQSSIYCQEAPLQFGLSPGQWSQQKGDPLDYQQVAQLDCLNKVVSLSNGAGNKVGTGEARRSPPTPWKPPAEMKTSNAGFSGNPYSELLEQGSVPDEYRTAMSREQGVMGNMDSSLPSDNIQQKTSYYGNGDGAGQSVQSMALSGQARNMRGAYLANNSERPLQGLMLSLSSSAQANTDLIHDNSFFPGMSEPASFQRDKAVWAAAMSMSPSQWETETTDHSAFLNNLATQIERNQQLSNGRLPNQSRSFPQDFAHERNPAAEIPVDRSMVARSYIPQGPAPPAPQFVHPIAPKESFSSQLNRLAGFQTNFNAPVYTTYGPQAPRYLPPNVRPGLSSYNGHMPYNGSQDWERLQSVGSFSSSRNFNNLLQPQDSQQFGKFDVNGIPNLKYKPTNDPLNWPRAQDSGLGPESFLDVANQQSGSLEFSRDYVGPRIPVLSSSDQLSETSGMGMGERLLSRGDGMAQKQQYWMGTDRNGWGARTNGDMGGLRSNPENFGHHGSGIPGRHQASVVPDNHVRDRESILGTGGRLFTESYQNQPLSLIHHGRDDVIDSYDPSESAVATSFPVSSNSTEMMSLRGRPDGSVRDERSLVATEQGGRYTGNLGHQVMKARVNPETNQTRDSFQEGEPAPSTPEKSDIVDGMELKCPHSDFGPSKQGMHDAASIVSMSEITCSKMVQPSTAAGGESGRPLNGFVSEQSALCSLDAPAVHMKPPSQANEHVTMSKSGKPHSRPDDVDTNGSSLSGKRRKVGENGNVLDGGASEVVSKAAVGLDMLVDAVQVASGSMQEKDMSSIELDNVAQSGSGVPQREPYPLNEDFHVVRKKVLRRAKSIFKRQSSFGAESNGSTNEVGPGELFNGHSSILSSCREAERDIEKSTDTALSPGLKEGEAAPVIRTKRGRAQMLPSRLRDSVLEPLKKGAVKNFKRDTSEDRDSGSGLYENSQKRLKEGSEDRGAPSPYDVKEEYGTSVGREDSGQGNYQDWSPRLMKESEGFVRGSAGLKHKSSPLSDVEVTWDSAGRTSSATGGLHPLEEFDVGDVVWAKSGKKNDPVWPAKVVDPIKEVPDTVRSLCVPGRLCVMFFGKSLAKKKERDYAWVRQGMIFPFMDYLDRFQGQTNFNRYRPIDFVVAINEATLAEAGFDECQGIAGKCHPSVALAEAEKQLEDSQDTEEVISDSEKDVKKPSSKKPVSTVHPPKNTCVGCGAKLSVKAAPKPKNGVVEDNPLCRHCVKLYKSRQYCGVCKKVWQPNEKGNWVQCDACNIWVHADCDKISNKSLKELEKGSYKCPECRKLQPRKKTLVGKSGGEGSPYDVPDSVAVVCSEMQADYLPKLHQISCTCKQCGHVGKIMKPSEWERHTGCRKKKWKESIRMKYLDQTLLSWIQRLMQGGAIGLAYAGPEIRVPPKMRAQQLAACLDLPYEPVRATFTTERCGVCRWVEDYDYNKMIVCNRCQIAVHEECYGVQYSDKAGPWVCRACETPEVERECCLCPVKGGAMKPTSVSGLWVHVTCAWFIREVTFKSAAKMEPAEGVTNIDLALFRQTCVVCRQVHGAVIQCCGSKCRKVYHTMCAFNAGYYMEINSYNDRNGVGVTRMITYCATHRTPDPEGRLHLSSPEGKIVEKRDYLYPRGGTSVVSILSGNALSHKLDAKFETIQGESSSAARCRPYDPQDMQKHKKRGEAIAYRVTGISWHSAEAINALRDYPEPGSTINERLASLPAMEKNRVCFGKSAIHGWGLFARRAIKEGEMVLEYRGDRVRGSVADLREEHYRVEGKDCYLFKVNEEEVIDATDKGNLGRLINHSCEPSCYSKIFEEVNERGEIRSRVVLMARKDVKAGEELTYDYRFDPEDKKVECLCGAPTCRQFMN